MKPKSCEPEITPTVAVTEIALLIEASVSAVSLHVPPVGSVAVETLMQYVVPLVRPPKL